MQQQPNRADPVKSSTCYGMHTDIILILEQRIVRTDFDLIVDCTGRRSGQTDNSR